MARSRLVLALALAAALAVAGCARNSEDRPNQSARLVLDFQPNAVHAGIYLALERDFDGAEGVTLSVAAPSSSTDSVKLLLGGRAQFAILDIHDLALAREKGRDVVGVMAFVQVPLAAVIAQPQIARPRDLEAGAWAAPGFPPTTPC
jgi:NitT/TauT family transport system substrate-binding protein/putative hydroxymethylpyrimidine transport system substrate-binding protein